MSFISEFKAFAMRGNVIDLAVGVIIGGAFGKIVSSLVGDVFMPILGLLLGGVNFTELKLTIVEAVGDKPAVTINYGQFLQQIFDFTIVAFAIFLFIKTINKLSKPKEELAKAAPSAEQQLLAEIRDILKSKQV
jgi:large conductance mechanosensitive channel